MVRRAKLSDVARIVELVEMGARNGKVLLRSVEEVENNLKTFFVWEEEDIVVGCCALEVYSGKLAELRSLVVLPQYQNQGIGGKLIRRCLDEAKNFGVYQVLAVTDRHRLFKIAGFKAKLDKKTPMFINLR